MTEPLITINGRALAEGQAMAVRVAISEFHLLVQNPDHLGKDEHGRRMTEAYKDRLDEVMQMLAHATEPARRSLTDIQLRRAERILQLAGIVPEQASPKAKALSQSYAIADLPVDEAAVRLNKALEEK